METTKIGTLSESERLLYSQFRKKINAEAAKAQVKKLEYNLADVTSGLAAIKNGCADGNALELGGRVFIFGNLIGSLIACIGAPHGGDETAIKVKAVKRAVKEGADEVEVTAPIAHIRDGNFSYVKREFKKLRSACKKQALRIDLECPLLTKQEILKISALAADCGVNSVKTSSGVYQGGNEIEMISDIKSAVKDRCTIKAEGVATVLEMSSALEMGASVIGSKNAAAVARAILASNDV